MPVQEQTENAVEHNVRSRLKALRDEKTHALERIKQIDEQIDLLQGLLPGSLFPPPPAGSGKPAKLELQNVSMKDGVIRTLLYTGKKMRAEDIESMMLAHGFKKTKAMSASMKALLSMLALKGIILRSDRGLYEAK